MKFAFILDTSPLMQIKKSVIGEFPRHQEEHKTEESKAIKTDKGTTRGMSFFEQSIYAIEEFIMVRKKMGNAWR